MTDPQGTPPHPVPEHPPEDPQKEVAERASAAAAATTATPLAWPRQPGRFLRRYGKRELLPALADLRLAISLLLAIAVFSIAGTVIEQGQSLAVYQENYPESPALFGFLTWRVILFLGLNEVYRSWWFVALLILFGASLTACTFTRQIIALRWFSRPWNFYTQPRQFNKLALSTTLPVGTLAQVEPALQAKGYKIFTRDRALYGQKGVMGRIGPIVVHASMLLILAGAIWGGLTGFFAQELIPSGNTFEIRNIFDIGPLGEAQVPQDWKVKVNRFWIDYTPEGTIDQFYSDLSVVDAQGEELKRKTIHVNEPLRYQGVTLYQADWGIAGVRVRFNDSPVLNVPMGPLAIDGATRLWGTWLPTNPDMTTGVSLVAADLQGTVLVYDMEGQLAATVRAGRSIEINGITLSLVEVVGSTGLQIKADPGIPLVYLGFGLLMVGVVMSYISHSQVWALETDGGLWLGGRTNRAQVAFERELLALVAGMGGE